MCKCLLIVHLHVKVPFVFNMEVVVTFLLVFAVAYRLEYDRSHARQKVMDDDGCSQIISVWNSLQRFAQFRDLEKSFIVLLYPGGGQTYGIP